MRENTRIINDIYDPFPHYFTRNIFELSQRFIRRHEHLVSEHPLLFLTLSYNLFVVALLDVHRQGVKKLNVDLGIIIHHLFLFCGFIAARQEPRPTHLIFIILIYQHSPKLRMSRNDLKCPLPKGIYQDFSILQNEKTL